MPFVFHHPSVLRLIRLTALLILPVIGGGRLLPSLPAAPPAAAPAAAPAPAAIEFFETKIRPVLVAQCLECHGDDPEDLGGGLSLAAAADWRRGGDSGPAIQPAAAADSLLLSALEYDGLEMPPSGPLPAAVIADFRRWIERGAADPRGPATPDGPSVPEDPAVDAASFWAFQPPQASPPPAVEDPAWPSDPLDRFILAGLEAADLTPAEPASPATLLRRLHYDLTGLPPTPAAQEAFLADPSERHYRQVVDRLLQSRSHAEHWARHWLDIARYADSNGSDFNATYHHAWRYRDYVIRSFAQDKRFDQFVSEQIAGDLMTAEDRQQRSDQIVATGFLMLGAKMLSERNKAKLKMDVVDEQIDTVGRAFLGLTLGCARCHDHKFDPIPTEDYYALAGIFRNTITLEGESQKYVSTWVDVPLPAAPDRVARVEAFEKQEKMLAAALKAAEAKRDVLRQDPLTDLPGVVLDDTAAKQVGPWVVSTYSKPFIQDGYLHDENKNKGEAQLIFRTPLEGGRYEIRLAFAGSGNRAAKIPVTVEHASGKARLHVDQSKPAKIDGRWEPLGTFDFSEDQPAVVTISNAGTTGYVLADALHFVPRDAPADSLAAAEVAARKAAQRQVAEAAVQAAEQAVAKAKAALAELRDQAPPPLPLAMAVRDSGQGEDAFICIRGEVDNRGPQVARGFLQVCGEDSEVRLPNDQSGRLQLARWITDPDHPLTARVIVNRVWMHLLGEGLVRTVDNFGALGDRPSHPALLDTLTVDFVRHDWSIRRLIRRIVTSQTYRQAAAYRKDAFAVDPENRLCWRSRRRRLPAEAIRDTLLWAGGQLDRSSNQRPMAGYGTLVANNQASAQAIRVQAGQRRSLYVPIIRGNVPPLLAIFDMADPDMLVGKRPRTNVPAQALVMLNHPQVIATAARMADRSEPPTADPAARLRWLYQTCLQRLPSEAEAVAARAFVGAASDQQAAWQTLAHTLIASTEFRFLD